MMCPGRNESVAADVCGAGVVRLHLAWRQRGRCLGAAMWERGSGLIQVSHQLLPDLFRLGHPLRNARVPVARTGRAPAPADLQAEVVTPS
jgi:hypothetical protein